MTEKQLALILIAIRELQMKIEAYPENSLIPDFQEYYGIEIVSSQEMIDELEELAQSINSGGTENV